MHGFWLLIPLFLIRYGLLFRLNKAALARAAHFAPMAGNERLAYWAYQLATLALLVLLCFAKVSTRPVTFIAGLVLYAIGVLLLVLSTVDFAKPTATGINTGGLYRFSRNPMYVAYFVYFLGCGVLTRSLLLLVALLAFQVAAHWVIKAEERWCRQTFGAEYVVYANKVRRYL